MDFYFAKKPFQPSKLKVFDLTKHDNPKCGLFKYIDKLNRHLMF